MKNNEPDSILFKILHPKEKDRYESYFNNDVWSVNEFGSLVSALDPTRLEKVKKVKNPLQYTKEETKALNANKLINRFLQDCLEKNRENPREIRFLGNDLYLSCWRYIKWIAENQISITKRFIEHLPLYLLELLQEFQPINIDLRTAHISSRQYHRARYLKMAEQLIQQAYPHRMSREEIYQHPSSQNLLREFVRSMGAPKMYAKRTVIESWLPLIDPNPERGRPPKKAHQKLSK